MMKSAKYFKYAEPNLYEICSVYIREASYDSIIYHLNLPSRTVIFHQENQPIKALTRDITLKYHAKEYIR